MEIKSNNLKHTNNKNKDKKHSFSIRIANFLRKYNFPVGKLYFSKENFIL